MERVAVITGASGRLGTRMAERFLVGGYVVVGVGTGCDFEADLTVESEVKRVFEEIGNDHGTIFALVHTAGMWGAQPLAETTLKDWQLMMDVNLTSTFLCFREAARLMGQSGGRLVAITSAQGADRGIARQAAYAAAKAGVVRLVEAAAQEYRARDITAHAVAPSAIIYGDRDAAGVSASDLVDAVLFLCGPAGASASGATWRLYGTRAGW